MALGGQDAGVKVQVQPALERRWTQVEIAFVKAGVRQEGPALVEALQPLPSLSNVKQNLDLPHFG